MNKGSIEFYDEKQTPQTESANTKPSINTVEEEEKGNPSYGVRRPLILYNNQSRVKAALV